LERFDRIFVAYDIEDEMMMEIRKFKPIQKLERMSLFWGPSARTHALFCVAQQLLKGTNCGLGI
jgi:hypothetical protein